MSISQAEIDFGKVAIARRLATQEQIRECVAIQQRLPQPLHLGAILVKKGYMSERDARELLSQVERGATGVAVSNGPGGSGPGSSRGQIPAGPGSTRPGSNPQASGAIPPGLAVCSACGARFPVTPAQGGQRFQCRVCGATVVAPLSQPQDPNGSALVRPAGYPVPGSPSGYPADPNGSAYPGGQGSGRGLHGTQVLGDAPEAETRGVQNFLADSRPGDGSARFANAPGSGSSRFNDVPAAPAAAGANEPVQSNLAADDPIAHVMEARRGADGSVETVFGPYDILGEIARGGMGIVYRARQRDLKRIVALKVMKEGEGASKKQVKRFQRETETAAKLQHPNIVAVHEVGCHQNFHYFTMDLIEGDALDEVVKRGEKMALERVLQIVDEVARAIHYAHGKGIIHRDLKPANILLDTDGHPKVTDFGLAKSIDHKSMLTRTGAVVGTPFYMPPEQAKGEQDIDQRADVYALGVILYELLTLKLPFHGETTMEVYRKILEEDPLPPRHHDPRIPLDVQTICQKAMDREPSRRYQTSKDLADDIQRYLQGEPIAARPLNPIQKLIRRAKKNLPVVIVGSVTTVTLLSLGGFVFYKMHKSRVEAVLHAKQHEWETFKTEFENQKINVRSQINSAMARMKDHDPNGALQDLREGVRILDDLPRLAADWKYNTKDVADKFFGDQRGDLSGIYRDAHRETGNAWQMKESPEAFDEALAAYKRALESDPSNGGAPSKEALDVHLAIAGVLAKMGKFDEALKTLGAILEKDPSHVKALLARGDVHDLRREHRRAIEDYTRVIDKELESNDAHLRRGGSYYELHEFEEAKKDFEFVIEHRDQDWKAYIWRGRVRQALGDYSGAGDDLTEAIDLQPSFPDGYFYRAELYFAQRKHAEAIKDYEVAITRNAQFYKAYLGLGRVLEWTLDYERAASQYEEVLKGEDREAEAERPRALAAKAQLLALRADRLEVLAESETKLREEKAEKGATVVGPPPALAELQQRAESERTKREKQARDFFDQALRLAPRLVAGLVGRARLSLAQGDPKGARADLDAALAALAERPWIKAARAPESGAIPGADPELSEVQALLGYTSLVEATRAAGNSVPDMADAVRRFEAALASDKECALARAGLGVAAYSRRSTGPDEVKKAKDSFRLARLLEGGKTAAPGRETPAKGEKPPADDSKIASEPIFFQTEGLKHAQNAERSKKPEYYVQARQAFARAVSRDPFHALAFLERGRLAASWKAWDLALEDASAAVAADPFLRDAYELRGFLLGRDLPEKRDDKTQRPQGLRNREKAIEDFAKAIEVSDTPEAAADAYYGRALARSALYPRVAGSATDAAAPPADVLAESLADVTKAIAAIPTELLRWMEDEATATTRIRSAVEYHELHGRILEAQGKKDLAKAAVDRAAEMRRLAKAAGGKAHDQGKVLRDRRNYSEAIAKFDRAIELDPELAEAYYDRGTCYLKIGNFVPGILDFSQALELNPRFADQFYNKVYQVSYVVDLNRVITELNKIVADHPDVSYVIFLRGFFYVAKTEFKKYDRPDLDAGIRDFDKTLSLNPNHVSAYIYRGFLYFKGAQIEKTNEDRLKGFAESLRNYDLAISKDPQSGIAHFLKAMCWSVQSQEAEISSEEKKKRIDTAIDELRVSIEEKQFKGFDRIKNDKGFEAIRNEPRVLKLIQGK